MRWVQSRKREVLKLTDAEIIEKYGFSQEEIDELRKKKELYGDMGLSAVKVQLSRGLKRTRKRVKVFLPNGRAVRRTVYV